MMFIEHLYWLRKMLMLYVNDVGGTYNCGETFELKYINNKAVGNE